VVHVVESVHVSQSVGHANEFIIYSSHSKVDLFTLTLSISIIIRCCWAILNTQRVQVKKVRR